MSKPIEGCPVEEKPMRDRAYTDRQLLELAAKAAGMGAIREVIESHVEEAKKLRHDPESQDYLYEQADKLTRALSGEKAGRVEGWRLVPTEPTKAMAAAFRADAGSPMYFTHTTLQCADFDSRYRAMLAASPAPDKEGA